MYYLEFKKIRLRGERKMNLYCKHFNKPITHELTKWIPCQIRSMCDECYYLVVFGAGEGFIKWDSKSLEQLSEQCKEVFKENEK